METAELINLLRESLFMILTFAALLLFSMVRGKQALVNLILGLYIALLISLTFPYYDRVLSGQQSDSTITIILFIVFTILATILMGKHMATDPDEPAFERFNKKALLAALGAILIMAFSFHVLPVTDLITPGSPIQSLFAPESHFFWWLIIPLAVLFFL